MRNMTMVVLTTILWATRLNCTLAANPTPVPTYLALGDSLAYGMQIGRLKHEIASGDVKAASFDTGYVDILARKIRATTPDLHVVDLGCPGETTSSFISGPCAYATNGKPFGDKPLPMHVHYTGAQLAAALGYLKNKAYQVQLITLDIGVNDLRAIEIKCSSVPSFEKCLENNWFSTSKKINHNLHLILEKLHSAAPKTRIFVMTYYNWLALKHPGSNKQVRKLNQIITHEAQTVGATPVHVFAKFNKSKNQRNYLCKLSLICGPTKDLHPTNTGYDLIAKLFYEKYHGSKT